MISLFIEALASGRGPTVHGDGHQTRDFTFVGDVVTGVLALLRGAPDVAGEVINVAAGGRISLLDLISTLQDILGKTAAPVHSARHAKATCATPRRTSRRPAGILDFSPAVAFEDGLSARPSLGAQSQRVRQ